MLGQNARIRGLRILRYHSDFVHRACAAFFAILERSSAVSLAALTFPPTIPPRRPSATAWGFFSACFSELPLASIYTSASAFLAAVKVDSSGIALVFFLLERLGILPLCVAG